jgi:hypothetical protein
MLTVMVHDPRQAKPFVRSVNEGESPRDFATRIAGEQGYKVGGSDVFDVKDYITGRVLRHWGERGSNTMELAVTASGV